MDNHKLPRVLILMRPKRQDAHSIEEIYNNLFNNYFKGRNFADIYFIDKTKSFFSNIKNIISFNADIIHITGDITYAAIFLCLFSKVIITQHDIGYYKNLRGIKKWIYKILWLKLPLGLSQQIITVSSVTKDDLIDMLGIPKHKITVIHNPIPDTNLQNQIKTSNDPPLILQVGTGRNKNLETVIKALSGLDVRMVIIGTLTNDHISLLNGRKIQFNNYKNITYSEVLNHYWNADVVTFVSTHEGFGMPVVEANLMGTPVVTSSLPVIHEVAGEAALFVENLFDEKEIHEKVKSILNNPEQRQVLIEKGYKNASRFSGSNISQLYIDVYKSI